jgi:seryl-tRNA synthetase
MKTALELELKKLDIDIKASKTLAKKNINLDEKLKAQRTVKDMEKKRNEMRKKLYEAQDEVDNRKEELIERVEAQLKQKTSLTPLFTIRWSVI